MSSGGGGGGAGGGGGSGSGSGRRGGRGNRGGGNRSGGGGGATGESSSNQQQNRGKGGGRHSRGNSSGGGGGGGRNRNRNRGGGRDRGGGGGTGTTTSNSNDGSRNNNNSGGNNNQQQMRDEDVLIAFMPYLKGNEAEAAKIHEDYQASNDQKSFLRAAREFLQRQQQQQLQKQPQQQQQQQQATTALSTSSTTIAADVVKNDDVSGNHPSHLSIADVAVSTGSTIQVSPPPNSASSPAILQSTSSEPTATILTTTTTTSSSSTTDVNNNNIIASSTSASLSTNNIMTPHTTTAISGPPESTVSNITSVNVVVHQYANNNTLQEQRSTTTTTTQHPLQQQQHNNHQLLQQQQHGSSGAIAMGRRPPPHPEHSGGGGGGGGGGTMLSNHHSHSSPSPGLRYSEPPPHPTPSHPMQHQAVQPQPPPHLLLPPDRQQHHPHLQRASSSLASGENNNVHNSRMPPPNFDSLWRPSQQPIPHTSGGGGVAVVQPPPGTHPPMSSSSPAAKPSSSQHHQQQQHHPLPLALSSIWGRQHDGDPNGKNKSSTPERSLSAPTEASTTMHTPPLLSLPTPEQQQLPHGHAVAVPSSSTDGQSNNYAPDRMTSRVPVTTMATTPPRGPPSHPQHVAALQQHQVSFPSPSSPWATTNSSPPPSTATATTISRGFAGAPPPGLDRRPPGVDGPSSHIHPSLSQLPNLSFSSTASTSVVVKQQQPQLPLMPLQRQQQPPLSSLLSLQAQDGQQHPKFPPTPGEGSVRSPAAAPMVDAATTTTTSPPPTMSKKEAPQPRRLWTHFEEQPGRIVVNGCAGDDSSIVITFGPREELTAHWSLPIPFLRKRQQQQQQKPMGINNNGGSSTIEDALVGLTVGLFRRGCTENGSQASIISKAVLGDDNRSYQFWLDQTNQCVRGKVPFYAPRTPGHVIFRLYDDDDSVHTLAMGPGLHVRVGEKDFESSVRFILSNFKGKKYNPTSLSSLHSLSSVLETVITRPNDSAARATWGCIQEARKVLEACMQEYTRTVSRLSELEETVEELKKQVEAEGAKSSQEISIDEETAVAAGFAPAPAAAAEGVVGVDAVAGATIEETVGASEDDSGTIPTTGAASTGTAAGAAGAISPTVVTLREKIRALLSGRASCERKWRDSQQAFASILRAVVGNPTMSILLRRDLITKMRLEFELWCPLSEEFALPNESATMWYDGLRDASNAPTTQDFRAYAQARAKMQTRILGFDPNNLSLEDVLFPRNRVQPNQRSMDPSSVSVFNTISAAMGEYYQNLFADEERVVRRRDLIRARTEECVHGCGAFPPGTRVVVFGSSANGFGSPRSDLDMCLQLPDGFVASEDDKTGGVAMSKLAAYFEESGGMRNVDTNRLSARIPIVMFHCPDPLAPADDEHNGNVEGDEDTKSKEDDGNDDDRLLIECDLSMHNPLAVMNTSLLRTYAEITPVSRVLASIIKRWAKARDINNPSRHTLSSYGYIVMLLHFLTYHKRTGNGLVSPVVAGWTEGGGRSPESRNSNHKQQQHHHHARQAQQPIPLLPNLQWIDPAFLSAASYRERQSLPQRLIKHPLVEGKTVNVYFHHPSTQSDQGLLQKSFSGQDLSLSILLASFFRYYAYEFDYKRHVVSLHSTACRGMVEREVKAELDGWRNYSAALTIEDPFETFYDVAHVLRGGYYHRIRREFAVAYSKIVDVASGRQNTSWDHDRASDLRAMTGHEILDWICEPVAVAAASASTATTGQAQSQSQQQAESSPSAQPIAQEKQTGEASTTAKTTTTAETASSATTEEP